LNCCDYPTRFDIIALRIRAVNSEDYPWLALNPLTPILSQLKVSEV